MLHKLSLLVASAVAALVIAGGLAIAGFGPAQPDQQVQLVDQVVPADAPTEPPVQVDTIYLTPQATPKDITVTRVKEAQRQSGDGEDEHDGGDDD